MSKKVKITTVAFHLGEEGLTALMRSTELSGRRPLEQIARENIAEVLHDTDYFSEQLYTFHAPSTGEIAVAYYALVREPAPQHRESWWQVDAPPRLSELEKQILLKAVERLRGKIRYQPIGFKLIPEKFTLRQLQRVYEVVLSQSFDKRNFRKKLRSLDLVRELDEFQDNVPHRAARLYRMNERRAPNGDFLV